MRILGIDPGLQKTGWGIIDYTNNKLSYRDSGTIYSDSKMPIEKRLLQLSDGIIPVIKTYQPNICAIEETFVNKNPISSLKLGHARGALILAVAQENVAIKEYAATLIKKSVVGVGRADKNQMQMMVKILLPSAVIKSEDAADALAVAICHTSFCFHNELLQ